MDNETKFKVERTDLTVGERRQKEYSNDMELLTLRIMLYEIEFILMKNVLYDDNIICA